MSLTLWTANYRYAGADRFDVTRQGADQHAKAHGVEGPGAPFAPSWVILGPALRGDLPWDRYRERYTDEMRASYIRRRAAWDALLARHGDVTIVCFCADPTRCHRTILAELLVKASAGAAVYAGERPAPARDLLPALSLWQPWASFVALGGKIVETRDWGTDYRGPIAIHAAKPTRDLPGAADLWRRAGRDVALLPSARVPPAWPLGAIVAVADLVDVFQVAREASGPPREEPLAPAPDDGVLRQLVWAEDGRGLWIPEAEFVLGDLSPGRFGWQFANVRALAEPIPCRGHQKIWTLPPKVHWELVERGLVAGRGAAA